MYQLEKKVNLASEHEAVSVNFKISEAITKQQFRIIRNTKNLNATNILKLLNEVDNFEAELKLNDVDNIMERMLEKLNNIVESLAPSKKVQVRKDTKLTKNKEVRKLFQDAKEAKRKAVLTGDPEMYRLVRNNYAVSSQKNFSEEVEEMKKNLRNSKFKWKVLTLEKLKIPSLQ